MDIQYPWFYRIQHPLLRSYRNPIVKHIYTLTYFISTKIQPPFQEIITHLERIKYYFMCFEAVLELGKGAKNPCEVFEEIISSLKLSNPLITPKSGVCTSPNLPNKGIGTRCWPHWRGSVREPPSAAATSGASWAQVCGGCILYLFFDESLCSSLFFCGVSTCVDAHYVEWRSLGALVIRAWSCSE